MCLSSGTELGIGSAGSACFNGQNMMNLRTGVQYLYFVHLLSETD